MHPGLSDDFNHKKNTAVNRKPQLVALRLAQKLFQRYSSHDIARVRWLVTEVRKVIEKYPAELKKAVEEADPEKWTLLEKFEAELVSDLCSGIHGKSVAYCKWLDRATQKTSAI